jgi:methyl-accepting chemotaxis protein
MNTKEVGNSILKTLFASVPYAGQLFSEIFIEYRSRIKQNRINAFSEMLEVHFSGDTQIDFSKLNRVEFSDLFEAVIQRVVRTDSRQKHERFRGILTNYLETPAQSIDHAETFLDLISSLDEPSIQILKYHHQYDQEFAKYDQREDALQDAIKQEKLRIEKETEEQTRVMTLLPRSRSQIDSLTRELQQVQEQVKQLSKYRHPSFYKLSDDDFLYLKQILVSKALLREFGVGTRGHVPYFHMRITMFGKQFIRYIKEGKHD